MCQNICTPEKEPQPSKKVPKNKIQNRTQTVRGAPSVSREEVNYGSLVGEALWDKRIELDRKTKGTEI